MQLNWKGGVPAHRRRFTLRRLFVTAAALGWLGLAWLAPPPARAQNAATPCNEISVDPNVDVTPSRDPPPDVVESRIDDALPILADWNATLWKGQALICEIPDPLPTGVNRHLAIVMDQTVSLTVLPPTVYLFLGGQVPDLLGGTLADARTDLAAAGLVPGVVQQDSAENWTVEVQNPDPGFVAFYGTKVSLTLLAPPEIPSETVTVPDIVGLSPDDAETVVEASGLVLAVRTIGEGDEAIVLKQVPTAGMEIDANGTVVATVRLQDEAEAPPPRVDPTEPAATFFPLAILAALLALVLMIEALAYPRWRQRRRRRS